MLYKPHPLQASATGTPRSGPTPLTVSFTGNASGGTGPVSFHWDFGDGTSSSEESPSHTYRFPGAEQRNPPGLGLAGRPCSARDSDHFDDNPFGFPGQSDARDSG